MKPTRIVACPGWLENLLREFIAEEATAAIRHDVRGKLASVRNGAFYIRRVLEGVPDVLAAHPRVPTFLQLIDEELAALGDLLTSRLAPPDAVEAGAVDPLEVCGPMIQALATPEGIELSVAPAKVGRIRARPAELQLAIFCLIENAIEAVAAAPERKVRLRAGTGAGAQVVLEVVDSGPGISNPEEVLTHHFSTKPQRLGVGLKIARRIARRWGGELKIQPGETGASVALIFDRCEP